MTEEEKSSEMIFLFVTQADLGPGSRLVFHGRRQRPYLDSRQDVIKPEDDGRADTQVRPYTSTMRCFPSSSPWPFFKPGTRLGFFYPCLLFAAYCLLLSINH
jgi:hypothetical protein